MAHTRGMNLKCNYKRMIWFNGREGDCQIWFGKWMSLSIFGFRLWVGGQTEWGTDRRIGTCLHCCGCCTDLSWWNELRLGWFGNLLTIPSKGGQTCHTGKRSQGRPRPCWRNYRISHSWPGNTLESLWIRCRRWLGRARTGDPSPSKLISNKQQKIDGQMCILFRENKMCCLLFWSYHFSSYLIC